MIKTCVECGKQFEVSGHYGHRRLCCSEECSKDRHRKRMREERRKAAKKKAKSSVVFLKCVACGETFPHQGLGRRPKYCHKCRLNGGKPRKRIDLVRRPKKRGPSNKITKVCPVCGKTFQGFPKRVYCGNECAKVANNRKTVERNKLYYTKPKVKKAPKPKPKADRCVCTRVRTCIYGRRFESTGVKYCDYITVEGHSRGGYPDECKHYSPKGR